MRGRHAGRRGRGGGGPRAPHIRRRRPDRDLRERPDRRHQPAGTKGARRRRRGPDIVRWARDKAYPIIPCNLCGSQENLQRQAIKAMLAAWDEANPGRVDNIARSMRHVSASHLADRELFDFSKIRNVADLLAVSQLD